MTRILMKGNEAIAEAAIRAGAIYYFAYPITPQSEVGEYMSRRLPEIGGVFVQAESEVAVGNMLMGAVSSGKRAFTSSSSPGISLMQEAISTMAGAELPVVLINIMRGGPGIGGILPSQADYFQSTKGGGHGDYRVLVLAPSTLPETVDLTMLAFHLADKYCNPTMVVADGMIGQMMEPVEFPEKYKEEPLPPKDWATTGCRGRAPKIIKSLFLDPLALEKNNIVLAEKYKLMKRDEVRFEAYKINPKNRILMVAYGTMARICQTVIDDLEEEQISIGLLRPITLFPFPIQEIFAEAVKPNIEVVLTVEMSMGQMVEDVEAAVKGRKPVEFYGRTGGIVPTPGEVRDYIMKILAKKTPAVKSRKGKGE
ncbi:MAG: 3-methyl-2-oxobutanoate dehydrogenase subunit VorB [Pseudomonadota bacterium]